MTAQKTWDALKFPSAINIIQSAINRCNKDNSLNKYVRNQLIYIIEHCVYHLKDSDPDAEISSSKDMAEHQTRFLIKYQGKEYKFFLNLP